MEAFLWSSWATIHGRKMPNNGTYILGSPPQDVVFSPVFSLHNISNDELSLFINGTKEDIIDLIGHSGISYSDPLLIMTRIVSPSGRDRDGRDKEKESFNPSSLKDRKADGIEGHHQPSTPTHPTPTPTPYTDTATLKSPYGCYIASPLHRTESWSRLC